MVDVASHYKEAKPLTLNDSAEVASALSRIYKWCPLQWPKLLQVDPGHQFMGSVFQLLAKHSVSVRHGEREAHRGQAIVEWFNCTIAQQLFGHQYGQILRLPAGQRSTELVAQLPAVISALNNDVTHLTGKKPSVAIREKSVAQKLSVIAGQPVGLNEQSSHVV